VTRHQYVGALIVQRNTILLGLRSQTRAFYPNVWDVFGGHIEPDEQPHQTLTRELGEELGITPTQWMHVETRTESIPESDEPIEYHLYHVTAWQGTPVNRQPEEHTAIQWFTLEQAVHLDLAHTAYPQLFARVLTPATPT
jgi:8-oxo-dGTP pyrophosphatase MutT (NUDIX family)